MMILLLLIHMTGIPLAMIQIKVISQSVPQAIQKQFSETLVCSTVHLCILRLLFRTVPTPAELTNKATIHYSRKARGQNTVHKQWPATVHSNSAPDRIIEVTICFRLKRYSLEVKAIYLPWFQQSPEGSKALSFYIRHPWHQSYSGFLRSFKAQASKESP